MPGAPIGRIRIVPSRVISTAPGSRPAWRAPAMARRTSVWVKVACSPIISNIVAGIVVVSAVLVVGGAVYGWWARRRRAELAEALA